MIHFEESLNLTGNAEGYSCLISIWN